MKIHTRTVINMMTGKVLEDEWYEYGGKVTYAGGGSGDQAATQTSTVEPPAFAVPFLQQILGEGQKQFEAGPKPVYPGQTLAPVTTQQEEALKQVEQQAIPGVAQTAAEAQEAQRQLISRADPSTNPYFKQLMAGIVDPITARLTEDVLPQISRGAVSAGQFGGARQGVIERGALSDYERNVLQATGQLGGQLYQQGTEALAKGLAFAPQIQQQQLLPAQLLGQVGEQRRGFEQQTIQDLLARFTQEQEAPGQALSEYARLAQGTIPGMGQTSTTTGTPATGGTSKLAGAAGGASIGFSMGGPYGAAAGAILGLMMS